MTRLVLGFDVGGTGARGILARCPAGGPAGDPVGDPEPLARAASATPLRRGPRGVDGPATAAVLTGLATDLLTAAPPGAGVAAVAVGCAGALTLGDDLRAHVPAALTRATGAATVLLCPDMLTAFFGALGGQPGVVLAAGTGVVALGGDLAGRWHRVDGWGEVLGDLGGGAWIGRAGLVAALRAHDGRAHGSPRLLAALRAGGADPAALVADLHRRDDRAAALAGWAPAVLAAARAGDPAAGAIRVRAAGHLADTVRAAVAAAGVRRTAFAGNLLAAHGDLRAALVAGLGGDADVRPAAGTAADGAVRLAAAAAAGRLPEGLDGFLGRACA